MGVKVATGCFNWSHTSIRHSTSSSPQTLASAISSPSSSRRRSLTDVALVCRYVHTSAMFGNKLNRSRSCEIFRISSRQQFIKRSASASLNAEFSDEEFSDEEFSKQIQELALRFQLSDDVDNNNDEEEDEDATNNSYPVFQSEPQEAPNPFAGSKMEPPDWPGEMITASIERKANSVELPFSLRIIKRKKQWQEGFREAGESAYCSVKKAFSSMVFIIRELQSYTLQMREALFYEDLQEILARVQKEMNASFVWLFQQVFSHTPTLMVYVMILLANYSVYSMSSNFAIAASPPPATMESVSSIEQSSGDHRNFDSVKSFPVNSGGKTNSIGGINGGGGKFRPLASGTDGDGTFDGFAEFHRTIVPDGISSSSLGNRTWTSEESVSGPITGGEYWGLWNSIVDEADRMQDLIRDGILAHETMLEFVSPVTAELKEDDNDVEDYFRTELLYQTGLSQEPDNSLLLANYAQFLYLVAQDYDRAEDYFKRASSVEPKDAEALNKYASFLWKARNDMWAAEEVFQEAIAADPSNSFYAASYANFLWSTGGDDTCFPLDPPETAHSDDI